jgi:hypothetical protein
MHRRLLPAEKLSWYGTDILLPFVVCLAVLLLLHQIPLEGASRLTLALALLIYWMLAAMATVLVLPRLRERAAQWLGARFAEWRTRKHPG